MCKGTHHVLHGVADVAVEHVLVHVTTLELLVGCLLVDLQNTISLADKTLQRIELALYVIGVKACICVP